ncbi:AAA family ATPase [Kitasatospora sp. MMS16-BH015]|uniref:ATP-binding protein n=1 Tax=Kitasatospora sp. MMS16-BH015 TaxID=2018025 RepID=UPI00131A5875|nr:LuxR family transcriptional regulator [Kitasatospora sp. MMS16-BH015]
MDVGECCPEQPTGLIGRAAELRALSRRFGGLVDGVGGVIELAGEPGIGKTRLLLELSAEARARGVQVLEGRATEAESGLRFGAYQDALGDRFRAEAAGRLLPPDLAGPLEPLFGDGAAAEEAGAGTEGVRLHQRVRSLLARWAERGPVLLLLDDLQWADPASVELTDHLIRHRVPGPLLLVLAHRPRQTALRLLDALARAGQSGPAERVEVAPLSAPESVALAGSAALARSVDPAGAQPEEGERERWEEIHQESGGNPLLVLALVDLAEPGGSTGERGRSTGRAAAVLLGELALMDEDDRLLAAAAAVLGERFGVEALAEVAGFDAVRAHRAATALIRRDILRPVPGTALLTFRHAVLHRLVHQHADPLWLVAAHRRALARLTRAGAPAVERARHAEHCLGEADPTAVRVLEEAAEAARRTDPSAAARWLGTVLAALPDTPAERDHRLDLEIALTRALASSGRLAESRDLLHEVLARMPADPPARRIAAAAFCARTERMLGHYSEAEALLRTELPAVEGLVSPEAVALMTEYGMVALLGSGFAAGDRIVEQAVLAARSLGDPVAEAAALAVRGLGGAYLGKVQRARRELAACAALADRLPDTALAEEPEMLAQLGWGELFVEQHNDAARHHDRGLRLARRYGQHHVLPHLLLGIGFRQLWTNEPGQAGVTALEAEEVARSSGNGELTAMAMALRAGAIAWTGEPGAALALAEQAARSAPAGGWWGRSAASGHAQALLATGHFDRCTRVLITAGGGPELPLAQVTGRPLWYSLLTAAASAAGDLSAARQWAQQAGQAADRLGLSGQQGFARRAAGLVAAADGQLAESVELLTAAAESFHSAGQTVQRALTLALGAPVQAAAGDRQRAEAWLAEAEQLAAETGATRVATQAAAARRCLAERPGAADQAATEGPSALELLTRREREIAGLAAEGARTREIADRLFLSPRTVDAHLAKVYRKLGVTSRTALGALLAAEGGLPPAAPGEGTGRG